MSDRAVNAGNGARVRQSARRRPDASHSVPLLTVVVPTRNERGNVAPLCELLDAVLPGEPLEVVFVDDSDDGTPREIERAAERSARPVRLVHRSPEERRNGLGGAVVEGIRVARGAWVCVMDGDLQHPPALIERMLEEARSGSRDVVVASRFRPGGDAERFGAGRRALSWLSTAGARLLFPRRLREVSDPMSGFFLLRRAAIDLDRLQPRGFKILVEILVRTPGLRVSEVGFHFGERLTGDSKAGAREATRYLAQLLSARVGDTPLRLSAFAAVGASGLAVNTAAMALFAAGARLNYVLAAALATQCSTAWNYALTERWVFRGREARRSASARTLLFFLTNNAAMAARIPLLVLLTSGLGMHYLLSNLASLALLTLVRFGLADAWIWGSERVSRAWTYDIHGILTVASDARLPELERFRVEELAGAPDVRVHVGGRGRRGTVRPVAARTAYAEALGRLGFAIDIEIADRVTVHASRLLGWSPHVLYTNVVEPILRWSFAERGYALVHAACVASGDSALLITARTDTGKTTTSLKILDGSSLRFVSDDLTLLCADGRVLAYPKPLTISRHTLHAVRTPLLNRRERMGLVVQSRLHSRSGRWFGLLLAKTRVPAATLNAIVQLLVPPPKYQVDRLVPGVAIAAEARVEGLAIIERGTEGEIYLHPAEAVATLLENCEDAFGFPPYAQIEHFLHSRDGAALRERERATIVAALRGVEARLVRSETMDWAVRLRRMLPPVPVPAEPRRLPAPQSAEEGAARLAETAADA